MLTQNAQICPLFRGVSRFGRLLVGLGCLCLQLFSVGLVPPSSAIAAATLSHDSLGVNFTGTPPDLATASVAGVGLARDEVISGSNTDAVVQLTAAAHLRLYPMLGLPRSQGPAADAAAMAAFVTSFAQRYGRRGSFWAQHPELPYLPVESYEIGNEPDITPTAPADATSLHYAYPVAYAQVYEAARTALHQVDPAAHAVVGGMLDSSAIGLDQAEQYLGAIGAMDAVGYHPYLYDVTRMEQDTTQLRQWLDANGHGGVPLDVNEFGAAAGVTAGPAAWGTQVAQYTQWALCTPTLHVENLQAFWWGAIPMADSDPWFPMVNSELSETPLGTVYLGEVQALTSQGCPPAADSTPPTSMPSAPTVPKRKKVHGSRRAINASRHHKRTRRRRRQHAPRRGKASACRAASAPRASAPIPTATSCPSSQADQPPAHERRLAGLARAANRAPSRGRRRAR
jgi:hypothetical protein